MLFSRNYKNNVATVFFCNDKTNNVETLLSQSDKTDVIHLGTPTGTDAGQ